MLRRMLLAAAGGSGSFTAPDPDEAAYPSDWGVTRFAGNPVIDVDDNPSETHEQYAPAPIRMVNGDIWVYVKGSFDIYAWKSTDDGETFSLENGGDPVLERVPGQWDDDAIVEPVVIYDEANGTIEMYYKATGAYNPSGNSSWSVGHATASDSDPTTFTKDPANPLVTDTDVSSSIGFNVYNFGLADVIKIGSTFHFYAYCVQGTTEAGAVWTFLQATGSDWDDIGPFEGIVADPTPTNMVALLCVFRMPGTGTPIYVMMYQAGPTSGAGWTIRALQSSDGETWSALNTTDIMEPVPGTWEGNRVYAASLLKVSVDPFALPYVDGSGRWLLYYSGEPDFGPAQPTGHHDNTGLAYLEPT